MIPRIGTPFPRQDALNKVSGREKYAVDYFGSNFVWAGVKRANIPHARLRGLEIKAALAVPGILAVLTHKAIPGSNRQGIIRKDQPVLVNDKARHCGDPVALVLAESKAGLQKALSTINIDWEPLPGIFTIDDALREGAPLVHEDHSGGNILLKGEICKGRGEEGLKNCDTVVEGCFELAGQEHAYLETEAGLAFLGEDGCLEITVSTQTPFRDRFEIAEAVGFDPEKIRIIAPYSGGAFGGKDGITVQSLLALAAIYCPGRPIKMWWDREESFVASPKRHPARILYRLGAKADGVFRALEGNLTYDMGPYDHLGGAVMALGLEHAGGPYRIPHVRLKSWAVYTNNPVGGAFRGFGVPQVTAAMEQMVDLMAEKLHLSPLEIRIKNAVSQGDVNPIGVTLTASTGLMECLRTVQDSPLWAEGRAWKSQAGSFRRRGIGLASVMHGMGYGPVIPDVARAKIELTGGGKFRIYSAVVDMGQGNASTYLQITGSLLNQEASGLELVQPDTKQALPSGSASASRTTYTFGNAVIRGVQALKENLLKEAALRLKLNRPEGLEFFPGRIRHQTTGSEISLADLGRTMDPAKRMAIGEFTAPVSREKPTDDQNLQLHGIPHQIFSYGAHLVYVEVDELTGRVEVKKYLSVTDCGQVLNPQAYEQQMQGGIAQGLGYALYEDFKVKQGRVETPNLTTYIIPTAQDVPDMDIKAVEIGEPSGPFGLKGAGEIAIDGPLPAVANALADALGQRIFHSPLTPERVLAVLSSARMRSL